MPKPPRLIHPATPSCSHAMVFICEKCGKRTTDDGKNPSHRLASKLKRCLKSTYGKAGVRIVLTSCMDICPEERIAVSLQPIDSRHAAVFLEVDATDLNESSEALATAISTTC